MHFHALNLLPVKLLVFQLAVIFFLISGFFRSICFFRSHIFFGQRARLNK